MKTYLLIPTLVLGLAGCSAGPLTAEDNMAMAAQSSAIDICYSRGWVVHPDALVTYSSSLKRRLASRGDAAVTAKGQQAAQATAITPEICRQLDMRAVEYVQHEAEQARQREAFSEAMDDVSESMRAAQQNRPVTTMCNSSPWGGMTTCSSF